MEIRPLNIASPDCREPVPGRTPRRFSAALERSLLDITGAEYYSMKNRRPVFTTPEHFHDERADPVPPGPETPDMYRMRKHLMKLPGIFAALYCCAALAAGPVRPSVEILLEKRADPLAGKRIGLITNQTGVDSKLRQTANLLHDDPRFDLRALFGPEHGIRGGVEAGAGVGFQRDPETGLPVHSLYSGDGRGPSEKALAEIDVLVYHIQDIGCRSYTYVWTMALSMKAAAGAGKPFIVLDVPNPLLPAGIDGPSRDEEVKSFIGLYPVPYVYGLTAGELARYLNEVEKIGCDLTVVPMENYRRDMSWAETGLPWVPTSPNIPSPEAAVCYPMTGQLGELYAVNIGVGWTLPFQVVGAPYLDAREMADELNSLGFEGILFRPVHYRPGSGVFGGQDLHGVQLHVTDVCRLRPVEIGFAIMRHVVRQKEFRWPEKRLPSFAAATGSKRFQPELAAGKTSAEFSAEWQGFRKEFREKSAPSLLYP